MVASSDGAKGSGSPPPFWKRRKVQVWVGVPAVLVGVLLGVVLLLPTLLSTSAGRDFIVSRINGAILGRVQIDRISLGWFSGAEVDGVRLFDSDNRLAFTARSLRTELTLASAVRGRLDLGKVTLDSPNVVLFEVGPDGRSNFERLTKPSDEPLILPELSASVRITNLTATVQGPPIGAPIRLDPSEITVEIPGLGSQPITVDARLAVRRDGVAGVGTITLKGKTQAVFGGEIDPSRLTADLDLTVDGLNLAVAEPFLRETGVAVAGLLGVELKLVAEGLSSASAVGELRVTGLELSGEALKGDRMALSRVGVPLSARLAPGPDGSSLITVERLGVESELVTLGVSARGSDAGLARLSGLRAPGSPGEVRVELKVPSVARLAAALPNTLRLEREARLTSGAAEAMLTASWTPSGAAVRADVGLLEVGGTRGGQVVRLEPVRLQADAEARFAAGGGGIADVSVRTARFDSGFGSATAAGTLSDLTYQLQFDLARLRQQAAQFVDLGIAELAGQLAASGTLKREAAPDSPLVATNRLEWTGVRFATASAEGEAPAAPVDIDRLAVESEAVLTPNADGAFVRAEVRSLRVVAGPEAQPLALVEAAATADLVTSDVPAFDVRRLEVNSLPEVQRRYGAFVPALAEMSVTVPTGVMRASAAGSFVGGRLETTRPVEVRLADVSVVREGRRVLWRDEVRLSTGLTLQTGEEMAARLRGFELSSSSRLVSVRQVGDVLEVRLGLGGGVSGSGDLEFGADLAGLAGAVAAWTGDVPQPGNQIRSGRAEGRLGLVAPGSGAARVSLTTEVSGLTVGDLVRDEALRVALTAASADEFRTAELTADLASGFLTAELRDARIVAAAESPFDQLPAATVTVRTDDLGKLDALLAAVSPAASESSRVRATRGSFAAKLRLSRERQSTTVDLTELTAGDVELQRGSAAYRVPEAVRLAGQIRLTTNAARELEQIAVPAMEGSLGVARLRVVEPILLSGLSGVSPAYVGGVEVAGRIQTVLGLVEVLQGATPGSVYPYTGDFQLTQQVSTQGNTSSATGTLTVTQLQLLDANGRPIFTEDRLEVANDVTYVAAAGAGGGVGERGGGGDELRLRRFSILSASSQALSVSATGVVRDLATTRTLTEPLRLEIGYDLAKLVPLVLPLLEADTRATLEGMEITGKHVRRFEVLGSLPSSAASNVAVRSLGMTGGLKVDRLILPGYGVVLTDLDARFAMREGVVVVTLPEPAGLNEGRLNLTGVSVDLSPEVPRLTVPKGQVLVEGVAMNRLVADQLGRFFGPLFVNTERASGQLRIRSDGIDRLPLGALLTATTPDNDGRAELLVSIEKLELVGGFAGDLVRNIPVLGSFFVGNVPQAKFTIARGVVSQDLPVIVGTQVTGEMRFTGNIELAEPQRLNPLQVRIGSNLLRDRIPLVRDVVRVADPVFVIRGTVRQPRLDFAAGIQQWIRDQAGGILPGLLGR